MEQDQPRVLFVDDEDSILNALRRLTSDLQAHCEFVNSAEKALTLMQKQAVDVVVSDMRMPEMSGLSFLTQVASEYPETIRIVLTGVSDTDSVMDVINEGRIWGYVRKPWDDKDLLLTLDQAIITQQALSERALLRRTVEQYQQHNKRHFNGFIGSSAPMQFIYNAIELSAPSTASIFITGASGTGKEVAAAALHALSPRKNKPFIALNCAAIPSELMESEIFGHVKGAFSGAVNNRKGAAELANGGTLFLDELSEMDIGLQAKLLRFIQSGFYQKVGSSEQSSTNIRFISATNRDPTEAIANKKLREDLYYRLNVINIALPALKDRDNDAVDIGRHFLEEFCVDENKVIAGFSKNAEKLLTQYHWPGNVRQLRNCIHNAVIMTTEPLVSEKNLAQPLGLTEEQAMQLIASERIQDMPMNATPSEPLVEQGIYLQSTQIQAEMPGSQTDTVEPSLHQAIHRGSSHEPIVPLYQVEKRAIESALIQCNDNVVQAAALLDVSPSTLYRKINNWQKENTVNDGK